MIFRVGDFMLCVEFRRVRLCVTFSFFFVVGLLSISSGFEEIKLFSAFGSCICHELGHVFAMSLFGSAPESVTLYGGGIKIVPKRERMLSRFADTVILLAGCFVNFLLAGLCCLLNAPEVLILVNLVLGIFNLLPFSYFDGGRILKLWLPDVLYSFIRALAVLLSAGLVSWLIIKRSLSPSLAATFVLVLLSELTEERDLSPRSRA